MDAAALQRIAFELLGHEARIRLKKADYPAAERLFAQVLPHARDGGFGEGIEFHLAVAALRQGRVAEAAAIVARIAPAFDRGQFRLRRGALRMAQADVHLHQGSAAEALASAEAGLTELETYPDADLGWKLHLRRGQALRALDRPDDALVAFARAAADVDDLRKGSLGYRLDSTFLTDKLPLFDEAIDLAAERDAGAAAAGLIEFVKSRALAAALSIPPQARRERNSDELRFDEIAARLDALEYLDASGSATPESKRERTALLAQRRDVAEGLRIADPRWRALSEPLGVDLDAVLALLAEDDRAALTLYHRPGRMVAVLLHGGNCRVAGLALDDQTEATLREYTENLQSWQPDEALFDISADTGIGWEHLIPAELHEDALGASTLLVVPHRTLHLLPWAGLRVRGRRLFEHTAVGVLPNLASLAVLDGEPSPIDGVALIGDPAYSGLRRYPPLPQAGAEIDDVAAIHAGRLLAEPVRGADATEAAFWTLAGRRDAANAVLHVACHATLEAGEPLTSGLLMTDAKVDAGEIALRRVGYPEVILSACSTAWRPDRAEKLPLTGDDALGLVASFLEAGARFVLASVPRALDDAARAFAVAWHRHRCAGSSPLGAVRATQLELAGRPELPAWSWVGITGYGCR